MEIKKYLQAMDIDDPDVLKGKTVSIVGLGGVGSRVAELLVRHNVNVRLVDKERVYEEEQPRHTLFVKDDISKFKAKQAKKHLEAINPNIMLKTFHEELTRDNAFLLRGDLIIDATNNPKITQLVYDIAMEEKIPFFSTNCAGWRGSLLILNPATHAVEDRDCLHDETIGSIAKEGMFSPVPGMIAGLLGGEVLRYLGRGELRSGRFTIDLENHSIDYQELE